jgi:hypothetical protein
MFRRHIPSIYIANGAFKFVGTYDDMYWNNCIIFYILPEWR